MKKLVPTFVLALAVLALVPVVTNADDSAPAGVRGEIIGNMMDAGGKLQELASAVPDAKYTWRPSREVRSVGEVVLHAAQVNYLIPMFMGVQPPFSQDEIMKFDRQVVDPARGRQLLRDSYAFASKAIGGIPDSDLDTQVEFFGMKLSKRAALMGLASHSHEHLGQLIAYARMNKVTPPWTAREIAEQKKKAGAAKAKPASGK